MRRLEHGQYFATSDQTAASEPLAQCIAERLLSAPFTDLSFNDCTPVTLLWIIARVTVSAVPVSFLIGQPLRTDIELHFDLPEESAIAASYWADLLAFPASNGGPWLHSQLSAWQTDGRARRSSCHMYDRRSVSLASV